MSNNGRRRWRQIMRSRRQRGVDAPTWGPKTKTDCTGVRPKGGFVLAFLRRHRESFHHEGGPPISSFIKPLPAKPRSARWLVGATMGARKRYARRSKALRFAQNHPHLMKPGAFERGRGSLRIGERLRPCPGCATCNPKQSARQMLTAWVRLSGWRGPFSFIRECNDGESMGRWYGGFTVHSPNGERYGGAMRADEKSAVRHHAAEICLNKLVTLFGWPNGCDGSGVLPARVREVPHV